MNEDLSGKGNRSTVARSAIDGWLIWSRVQARDENPTCCFAWSCKGKMEKYLYRQGSQRNAGMCRCRQRNLNMESTCSGEMRFRARLPQIGQWAWSELLKDISRAWKRALQPRQRHGKTPTTPRM